MNISADDLRNQYLHAFADWPFIIDVERQHNLPRMLLFAVGSRETGLTDETGDNGHGHGVWQLDDRSHQIPNPFTVEDQAQIAASMLHDNFQRYGTWIAALNVYNSGSPNTDATTGKNYGPDVWDRLSFLQDTFPPIPTVEDDEVYWGKDGATLSDQVNDARTAKCREWWLTYHGQREPSVQALEAAVNFWKGNGGDLTQAGIRDGRFGQ